MKSQILQTCLQTLFVLPPGDRLKSCLPPLDLAPDVMVTACSRGRSPLSGCWVGLSSPCRVCEREEHGREPWPGTAFILALLQPCLDPGKACVLRSVPAVRAGTLVSMLPTEVLWLREDKGVKVVPKLVLLLTADRSASAAPPVGPSVLPPRGRQRHASAPCRSQVPRVWASVLSIHREAESW